MDYCDYKHIMQNHGCPINPPVIDLSGGGANPINGAFWNPLSCFDAYVPEWPFQLFEVKQGDPDYPPNHFTSVGIYGTGGGLALGLGYDGLFLRYRAFTNSLFIGQGLKTYDIKAFNSYGCVSTTRVYHYVWPNLIANVFYVQPDSAPAAGDGRIIFEFNKPASWAGPGQAFIDWFNYSYGLDFEAFYPYQSPHVIAFTIEKVGVGSVYSGFGGPWNMAQLMDISGIQLDVGASYRIVFTDDCTFATHVQYFTANIYP